MMPFSNLEARKARKEVRKVFREGVNFIKKEPVLSGSTDHGNPSTFQDNAYRAVKTEMSDFGFKEESYYSGNETSHELVPCSTTSEIKHESTSPFPDLVIFYDPFKTLKGLTIVNKCLQEFNYEPLYVDCKQENDNFHMSVSYNGVLLAEGYGPRKQEAEIEAGAKLLQKIRSTNYAIEPKPYYFTSKRLAAHVRVVDPSQSHIYKVVCLKEPSERTVPFQLTGAVDFVSSEVELWQYIERHINCSEADLYVLNVEKPTRSQVIGFCNKKKVFARKMVGVSDKGVYISCFKSIQKIFEELKKCGGENIKYRLIPPGGKLTTKTDQEKEIGPPEVIEITEYIADKLILRDFIKEDNTIETPYEIIFLSVRSCSAFGEFIVERKFDKNTYLHIAEALIDRNVVGRAREYIEKVAKAKAAENALENLKRSCVYLKAKMSYFEQLPPIVRDRDPFTTNKLFRVVDPSEATTEEEFANLLLKFKNGKIEDLFFPKSFSMTDRKLVSSMARDLKLLVRNIGKHTLCVYKRRSTKELYKELLNLGGENEKYLIIEPTQRSSTSVDPEVEQYGSKQSKLKNLFDFGQSTNQIRSSTSVDPEVEQYGSKQSKLKNLFDFGQSTNQSQETRSEFNQTKRYTPCQTVTSLQNERENSSYPSFANSSHGNWSSLKASERQNQRWHSEMNKRPYDEGPGSSETQSSNYSQYSFKRQKSQEQNDLITDMQDNSHYQQNAHLSNAGNYSFSNQRPSGYRSSYHQEQWRNNDRHSTGRGRWAEDRNY